MNRDVLILKQIEKCELHILEIYLTYISMNA